jgi:hypothetical protein
MAYVHSVNNTPANGGEAMYLLKELLKTAGWTVIGSTDNATTASSDLWVTASIANLNVVWIILQKPSSTNQILIQRQASEGSWLFYFSRNGYDPTTGTTTVRPSTFSSDEVALSASGYSTAFLPTGGTYRYHVVADNAAPYSFWSAAYAIGGGTPLGILVYDPIVSGTESNGDSDPYAFILGSGTNGLYAFNIAYLNGPVYYPVARAFLVDPTVPANFVTVAYAAPMLYSVSGSFTYAFPGGAGTNPFTSNEDLVQALIVRHVSYPAPVGYKGISTLIRFVGSNRATGDTISTGGAYDWIVMSSVALPWPTGVTPDV